LENGEVMVAVISDFLRGQGLSPGGAQALSFFILIGAGVLLCAAVILAVNKIILKAAAGIAEKKKMKWAGIMLENKVFHRITYMFPAAVIWVLAGAFAGWEEAIGRAAAIWAIVFFLFVLAAVVDAVQEYYAAFDINKMRPIKGFMQLIKIVIYCLGGIVTVATLTGQSAWALLTGIGAFSAVLLLIFKDSILGLVAGVQLAGNDMVAIGDWITMEKYGADGDVVDISLTTVKVLNFDNTVTSVPAYNLVSDSFINWRNIQKVGARRVKRAVNIDMGSVCDAGGDMLAKMEKMQYLSEYISQNEEEIRAYNEAPGTDPARPANGRRPTNLGLFRAYLNGYLKNDPKIRKDLPMIVRQLAPGQYGIPLEVYAFFDGTVWATFEGLQADLFDFIISAAPLFGLRIFQSPAGSDFKEWRH